MCVCVYVYINIYYTHIHAPLGQNPLTVVEFLTVGYRDLQFTKSAQAILEQSLMFVSHSIMESIWMKSNVQQHIFLSSCIVTWVF